jgi:hypothetical protein
MNFVSDASFVPSFQELHSKIFLGSMQSLQGDDERDARQQEHGT